MVRAQEDNTKYFESKLISSKEYEKFLGEVKDGGVTLISEIQCEDKDIIKFEDENRII